ncbi:MAG: PilZ domain-containing protein [Polyangiaceae bacterium]|nr:PilZ domain-containing protein [Polyangiaceae bacterium]
MLTFGSGASTLGDVVDLSARGAAVVVAGAVAQRGAVTLHLDPDGLPLLGQEQAPPPLPAVIVARREDGAKKVTRVGLRFTDLPPTGAARLGALLDELLAEVAPVSARAARGELDDVPVRLAATEEGREALFQAARARLAGGDLVGAREAAAWTLRTDPHNPAYRALVHRINAEEALAKGALEPAQRELARARGLLPADPELEALASRLSTTPTKGLLGRLFAKRLAKPHSESTQSNICSHASRVGACFPSLDGWNSIVTRRCGADFRFAATSF